MMIITKKETNLTGGAILVSPLHPHPHPHLEVHKQRLVNKSGNLPTE